MKKEPQKALLISAWDTYTQHDHVVCKEKMSKYIKSFSINQHVTVNPYSCISQDMQALVPL